VLCWELIILIVTSCIRISQKEIRKIKTIKWNNGDVLCRWIRRTVIFVLMMLLIYILSRIILNVGTPQ
jgi:hypothetical protein